MQPCFLPDFLRDLNFTWISTDILYFLHENINCEYKNCSMTFTAVLFIMPSFILKTGKSAEFY